MPDEIINSCELVSKRPTRSCGASACSRNPSSSSSLLDRWHQSTVSPGDLSSDSSTRTTRTDCLLQWAVTRPGSLYSGQGPVSWATTEGFTPNSTFVQWDVSPSAASARLQFLYLQRCRPVLMMVSQVARIVRLSSNPSPDMVVSGYQHGQTLPCTGLAIFTKF